MEHFDSITYIVTVLVTIVGGWYTMKFKSEQNTQEIKSLEEDLNQEIEEYKSTIITLFKRIDELRNDFHKMEISSSQFATKEDVRSEHYTKAEFDQYLKNMEVNHREDRKLLDNIYNKLINFK